MATSRLLLTLASIFISWTECVPIDNAVETEPQITCGPGFIAATFLLRNNFDGHVFVKNHYNESQCRSDQTGKRSTSITVSFNTCGVQRTRSLNPKGVFVNTVFIITFHPRFITKVDRAYSFQCFYMESEKTVAAQIDISEMTSVFQTQRVNMPVCRYEVLDAQPPNGQLIRYALVGQQVFHRWTCDTETSNTFCMNVNSCFVYDGLGDQAQLLDVNGCAVDRYLLQNLEYTTDLSAIREAHVFKFADRAAVYFQCQIGLTVKEPGLPCPRPTCPPLVGPPQSGGGTIEGRPGGHGEVGGPVSATAIINVTPHLITGRPIGGGSPETNGGTGGHEGGHEGNQGGHEGGQSGHEGNQGGQEGEHTAHTTYPGEPQHQTNEGREGGRSSPTPEGPRTTTTPTPFIITTQGQFRTTSNASYRGSDDEIQLPPRRAPEQRNRHRKQRSSLSHRPVPSSSNEGSGQDLGVWDVRAPAITIFDLDDTTAMGMRNHSHHGVPSHQWFPSDNLRDEGVTPMTADTSTGGVDHLSYCLSVHVFALLLAMAVTPTCALMLVCFLRYMQRGARKLY